VRLQAAFGRCRRLPDRVQSQVETWRAYRGRGAPAVGRGVGASAGHGRSAGSMSSKAGEAQRTGLHVQCGGCWVVPAREVCSWYSFLMPIQTVMPPDWLTRSRPELGFAPLEHKICPSGTQTVVCIGWCRGSSRHLPTQPPQRGRPPAQLGAHRGQGRRSAPSHKRDAPPPATDRGPRPEPVLRAARTPQPTDYHHNKPN